MAILRAQLKPSRSGLHPFLSRYGPDDQVPCRCEFVLLAPSKGGFSRRPNSECFMID